MYLVRGAGLQETDEVNLMQTRLSELKARVLELAKSGAQHFGVVTIEKWLGNAQINADIDFQVVDLAVQFQEHNASCFYFFCGYHMR